MTNKDLEKAYKLCENVIRKHSTTFYLAFKQLPKEDANAVFAIYAFCRIADDYADLHQDRMALEELAQEFSLFLNEADKPQKFYWHALADVFERYPMKTTGFEAMLRGQMLDLTPQQLQTEKELQKYCYYVAGSVGEMLLPIICDDTTEEMYEIAINLGEAMQITNILRDVGADAKNNRCYLPVEHFQRFACSFTDIVEEKLSPNLVELLTYYADKAENLYDKVMQEIKRFKKPAQLPVLLSLLYYKEVLTVIREHQYDVFRRKLFVPKMRKQQLYAQAKKLLLK